ncbi:hypothetical protein D3C80_1630860 [compost metagenome]
MLQVRDELLQQGLLIIAEGFVVATAADADAALGAVAGVDVGAEDMEHVLWFEEILIELGIQPIVIGDELGQGDDLTVGQIDKGVEGEEVLAVGGCGFGRGTRSVDHQANVVLTRWPQDESDEPALQMHIELVEKRRPRDALQRPSIEVAD